MSRTYRRKKYIPEWVLTEAKVIYSKQFYYKSFSGITKAYKRDYCVRYPLTGDDLKTAINEYQRDGKENKWHNPPSSFVNMTCQRKFRNHQRQVIKKIEKSGDYEDYVFVDPDCADWKWS